MARPSRLRPRNLAVIFGAVFLVMAVISWWFAGSSGYRYGVDATRWGLSAYLVAAAALLAGVGVAMLGSMRSLDRRIDEAEGESADTEIVEETVAVETVEEPASEDVPPPLAETEGEPDHVDKDIDELLVSLQEMETASEETVEPEPPRRPAPPERRTVFPSARRASYALERLKARRQAIPAYFAGPAVAAVGIIGVTAAVLPGADVFLQSYWQLDTSILLGIGYSFGLVAIYTAISFYAALRAK